MQMKLRNAQPETAAFGENLSEMKAFGEITHPPFTPREIAPSGQEWIRSPIAARRGRGES